MIDQGRLVPSFLSHLKIIMCTGIIFTVHKHSRYCSYGLAVPQEKNTFLLPILVPAHLAEIAAAMHVCSLRVIICHAPGTSLRGTPGDGADPGTGLLPLDRVPSLGDNHRH